jgi:hypothetical protein
MGITRLLHLPQVVLKKEEYMLSEKKIREELDLLRGKIEDIRGCL